MEVTKSQSNLLFPPSFMATLFLLVFVGQGNMTAKAQTLWVGNLTRDVLGPPADFVWPYFADVCNSHKIAPLALSFCVGGVSGQVGQQRYLLGNVGSPFNVNETYVRWEKHNLTSFDPANRTYTYTILENNQGITTFIGTYTVLPKDYGCQIKWDYVVSPFGGFQSGQVRGFLQSILERVAKKIENLLINIE